jgi:hypothetical protein
VTTVSEAIKVKKTSVDSRGTSEYRSGLRAAIRGLWVGVMDRDQFWDAMSRTVRVGLKRAWNSGAADCGISPDELSPAEVLALQNAIDYEHLWIGGFANTIGEGTKAKGGKLSPLFVRAEVWIGRWEGVRSQARVMACADQKLKWTLGPTEHCDSCKKLADKVKRASWWNEQGILPRVHDSPFLACHGFR